MPAPLIAIGAATAVGGIAQASAASKAAKAQTAAANAQADIGHEQLAENRRQYDQTVKMLQDAQRDTDARFDAALTRQQQILNGSAGTQWQSQYESAERQRDALTGATTNALADLGRSYDDQSRILGSGLTGGETALRNSLAAQEGAYRTSHDTAVDELRGAQGEFRPYMDAGDRATDAMQFELGLGARPSGYQGIQGSEAYRWRVDEGNRALDASAAARGGGVSGRALQAAQEMGQGLASQEYDAHYGRLAGMSAQGLSATGANAGLSSQIAGINQGLGDRIATAQGAYGAGIAGLRQQHANSLAGARDSYGANSANAQLQLGNSLAGVAEAYGNNTSNIEAARATGIANAHANWAAQGANSIGNMTAGVANAGNNYLAGMAGANSMISNALAQRGNAQAAGAVGMGNALSGGIQNGIGLWAYGQGKGLWG